MVDRTATLSWTISGRVQGVGFRWFTRKRAERIGVTGWVRNNPDGSVTVVARGSNSQLADLSAALRQGPVAARVAAVTEGTVQDETAFPTTFEIR